MKQIICGLLLALWCGAAVPAQAQDSQPLGAITVDQTAASDVAIRNRIRDIMGQLGGYANVRISVREGIVTFTGEALDAPAIARLDQLAARVDGVVAITNTVQETTDVAQRLDPVLERFAVRARNFVAFTPLILVAVLSGVLVGLAGWLMARWDAPFRRFAPNVFIADIYRTIIRLVFAMAGVIVALDILGATALLGTLLGAAGIVGLAVGFAVRDTVENFIASVMLSLRQPFRPDDVIEIDGDIGTVMRLTSRATILLDPDGNHIRLPNALVFKARIVNYTRNAERRFSFDLGVDPATDLVHAKQVGEAALRALPFVLDAPAPQVLVAQAGDSTIVLTCLGWINQTHTAHALARSEALRMTLLAMGSAGIVMPEPTYRMIVADNGAAPEPQAAPAPAAVSEDVTRDTALDQMVREERADPNHPDLLSDSAPVE
jgi:small conductance mechanosensitive channel